MGYFGAASKRKTVCLPLSGYSITFEEIMLDKSEYRIVKKGTSYWFEHAPRKKYSKKDIIRALEDTCDLTHTEAEEAVSAVSEESTKPIPAGVIPYATLKEFVEAYVRDGHLSYNDLGQLKDEGRGFDGLVADIDAYNMSIRGLGKDAGVAPLATSKHIIAGYVKTICEQHRVIRTEQISKDLAYNPLIPEDLMEQLWRPLIDYSSEEEFQTYMDGLRHWMWLVKRRFMLQADTYYEMMPVFYGTQNVGKSVILRALGSPFGDFGKGDSTLAEVSDVRNTPVLKRRAIISIEEMAGAERTQIESIKAIITGRERSHRLLGTHETQTVEVRCCLIGTTNRHIGDIIYDPTGMRRFLEIPYVSTVISDAHLQWARENVADIWRSIDENSPSCINMNLYPERFERLKTAQEKQVRKTIVSVFFKELDLVPKPGDVTVPVPLGKLYTEYRKFVTGTLKLHDTGRTTFEMQMQYIPVARIEGEKGTYYMLKCTAFTELLKDSDVQVTDSQH